LNIPSSPQLNVIGSPLPVAGGISSALQLSNPGGAIDGCEIQVPTINAGGNVSGFTISVYDSLTDDTTTGFTDRVGNPLPEPQIAVGQAFLFNNLSGSPIIWTQILNVGP